MEQNMMQPAAQAMKPVDTQKPEYAVTVESARASHEIQGAIVSARNFPRNENQCFQSIMEACKRPSLATKAMYSYPRGGQTVKGPSIRLAEVLAQNWCNIKTGIKELSQSNGESLVEAFAWDLEKNVWEVKQYTIKHERKSRGNINRLTDPRDIYEMVANQGARRKRACILGIIPADIVEAAVEQCELTLKEGLKGNFDDKLRRMTIAFKEVGVTQEHLEEKLGHDLAITTLDEFVELSGIYQSIKDHHSKREDHFNIKAKEIGKAKDLNERLAEEKKKSTNQGAEAK